MAKRVTHGIDPAKLDQLIHDLGIRVRVWRSTLCPNMTSLESMDHDINCSSCNGNMIDFDPYDSIVLFQQQDLVEAYKLQGTFDIDKVLVSFPAGISLQRMTKVELLDFEDDFYELVQRQEDTATDKLKYKACTVMGIFTIEDGVKVRYHFGTDFDLDVDGNVKWLSTSTHWPDDRKIYTIYYRYHPIFRTIEAVHRDRYSQFNLRPETITTPKKTVDGITYVKLPETWVIMRDYLVNRRNRADAKISPNAFYDPNEDEE